MAKGKRKSNDIFDLIPRRHQTEAERRAFWQQKIATDPVWQQLAADIEDLANGRIQFSVPWVARTEILEQTAIPDKPVVKPAPKKRKKPQVDRVLRILDKLDTDGLPASRVRQKVASALQDEFEKKGLAVPGRDSINRALRQYRSR